MAAILLTLWTVGAEARRQLVFGGMQKAAKGEPSARPLDTVSSMSGANAGGARFNPLEHMSGIAPYHDAVHGVDSSTPPKGCSVRAAAWLIRHSCIAANSDEYADYMKPFVEKVEGKRESLKRFMSTETMENPLSFLAEWQNRITDDMVSQLTEPGKDDAFKLGRLMKSLYPHLLPPTSERKRDWIEVEDESNDDVTKKKKKKKHSKDKKKKKTGRRSPFKVFSASSTRDIETAQSFIRGAFPKVQAGGGDGDGKIVSLIKVPNDDQNWAESLTPHKICPAFNKERGKPEAQVWLEIWATPTLARLNRMLPRDYQLTLDDVVAMLMFCGYESVTLPERSSRFCSLKLFTERDFKAFGSWFDLKYWYQVGYGAKYSPFLGVQWLNSTTHLLTSVGAPSHNLGETLDLKAGKDKLPTPRLPPGEQHEQLLGVYFTHREEPPLVLTALGLWNETAPNPFKMEDKRLWVTSHLLPFLGHVALERLDCSNRSTETLLSTEYDVELDLEDDQDGLASQQQGFVRVIVNGAVQKLDHCKDGPGGSCEIAKFEKFVAERVRLYGNLTEGLLVMTPPASPFGHEMDDGEDCALDAFAQSLTSLFDHVVPLHGSPNQLFTYSAPSRDGRASSLELQVWIPPQSINELFAHHVWNSSLVLADEIALGKVDVRDKIVLELGAGAGIPSIVAAISGDAKHVVLTDFDDPAMIDNLRKNVSKVIHDHELDETIFSVQGLTWGSDPSSVLGLTECSQGFDVILLADCIWNGFAHEVLIASLKACLRKPIPTRDGPQASFIQLVSGFHSGRACVRHFLRKAEQVGLVETGEWTETSVDKRTRHWGWDLLEDGSEPEQEVETESERNKWVLTGQLAWRI
ncbi:hypothetical protein OIV83_004926 [Microbotryomycetes sp. JL201]|nr:hypothetical protein OIV83_004926 [Microbotryomycetes sp. JL201]